MPIEYIKSQFLKYKEDSLKHRYITNAHIEPLLKKYSSHLNINAIRKSVLGNPIYSIKIGSGHKKILMWSQMHGNESTTTKAVFDLINTLVSKNTDAKSILKTCTLYIIPILNPDGAYSYTRVNANKIDLNRDAQNLSQPESKILRSVFDEFKPNFCYNLHGQRTIFSAGNNNKPATISFLAPAQDKACTVTKNRKVAMEIIGVMNNLLQKVIPNFVGVYDDAYNLNCVGDTFQSANVPTILFEAGHYPNDYGREKTREYIYMSLLESLNYIATNRVDGKLYESYTQIPENKTCFFDVIIRNAEVDHYSSIEDIGIMFQEKLVNGKIEFIPKVEKIGDLSGFFGHKELDAKGLRVQDANSKFIKVNNENDFVVINYEKISLFP